MCFAVCCKGATIAMHSHVVINGTDGGHQPLVAKQVHGGLVVEQDGVFEVNTLLAGSLDIAKIIINRIIVIGVIIQGVALSQSDFLVGLLLGLPARV